MSTNFVNRKASQSLRGQAVLVTLDGTDSANLDLLSEGQICNDQQGRLFWSFFFSESYSAR
jgi:hypothetical protein